MLVANLTPGPDGRWRSLDGRALYAAGRTAGFLYEAELRAALVERLGVAWKPVRRGLSEILGVPEEVLRGFSRRRVEIEAALAERGESSARAAQAATLDTRVAKDHEVGPESLASEWRERAEALGFGPDQLSAFVGHTTTDLTSRLTTTLTNALTDPHNLARRLTEEHSSFDRFAVLRELAEHGGRGVEQAPRSSS